LSVACETGRSPCSYFFETIGSSRHHTRRQPSPRLRDLRDLDIPRLWRHTGDEWRRFTGYPESERPRPRRHQIQHPLAGGFQVDLRLVPIESRGAALQYFTGSKAHNIALRDRAMGWVSS